MIDRRSQFRKDWFPTTIGGDFLSLVVGECLGAGSYRSVFEWLPDPKLVVKFETASHSFSNVREMDVWRAVEHTPLAKWFAPVVQISECGMVLLMKRTNPIVNAELPTKVPAFFTDLKRDNWGLLGKSVVCHDYGNHLMLEKGMTNRMRNADWWELGQ